MPPPLRAAASFGIAYRPMTDEDLPFIAALFASTRADEVAQTGWPAELQQAFLAQQHSAQHQYYRTYYPDAEWLVVEQDGEPVGRLSLDRSEGRHHIIDISLLPELRGRGIGGAIMADLLDDARTAGQSVSIHVERNNPALHLYHRLGFSLVEDQGVYLHMTWRPDEAGQ